MLKETRRSRSVGGRRMTDAEEVSGVNVSLPPLLNTSSSSSSGSGSVSDSLYFQQGIVLLGSQLSQLSFLTRLKEGPAEQLSLFRAASEELLEEMMKELTGTYPFLQQAHECLSFKKPCQFAGLYSSHALPLKLMKVS
ncbi:uncharacterized protein MONOS_14991 [Monocercomonoides exilis]|uniref:uncharacterized protein n=1 Tax=Monocercomonoides exilis TaxID=2049356 RepID=UPI0035593B50|nr:hypothetical protein MONOS_14991 [Monocercomonoides exilis]|eukprot:MONOS_14991.1-p1 / transcript=MONOS_14991.1 / gene=MONOS_14991 / organism=Monocercomonoides_exilis_PA203 / gene_product=unspecified product / transcript_product=unspecified product / location=Mono_scaffold01121:10609-11506(+) / protein_length=138 / sequence_SO=supercontig / SO=protein_coding / is_pseudo=false